MNARTAIVGVAGAATYLWGSAMAPPDYSKPLTDAGLIVLGVWLFIMATNAVMDLIDRSKKDPDDDAPG